MLSTLSKQTNLADFLKKESDVLFELSSAPYADLEKERHDLELFILLNQDKIEALDFTVLRHQAFLMFLFDLSERLELSSCLQLTYYWLKAHEIQIGSRLEAAALFTIGISVNRQFIDRFTDICTLLEETFWNENDSTEKILATFTNYYLAVLSRHPYWIEELRECIRNERNTYFFLYNEEYIDHLLAIDYRNVEKAVLQIHELKDTLFNLKPIVTPSRWNQELLIEGDNEYAELIQRLPPGKATCQQLRKIAYGKIPHDARLNSRGIAPLKTETELFQYIFQYGNMHYAKIEEAGQMLFQSLAKDIRRVSKDNDTYNIEIIDWACGQALASVVLTELLMKQKVANCTDYLLIEPSEIALKRGSLHVRAIKPSSEVTTICKTFDELIPADVQTHKKHIKIHLFSNILDMDIINLVQLEKIITETQSGINYFICTSPFINAISTNRINSFVDYFRINYELSFQLLGQVMGRKQLSEYWMCNYKFKSGACHPDHNLKDFCPDMWTRFTSVFKVDMTIKK